MRSLPREWILLLFLALFLAGGAAQAASSGTLVISGTVPLVNDLVITPVAGVNTSLNITGGASNLTVANVAETSNNGTGYTVTLSSANAGQLSLSSDATKNTTYQVSYNSGAYATPTVAAATVKTISSLSALTTNTSSVRVNVTAFATAPAGTYSDTLTFAIVANP
jgi:hypothetical protein